MKFLILLVAIFIFSVLLIAVSHDPQAAETAAKPPEPEPQPRPEPQARLEPQTQASKAPSGAAQPVTRPAARNVARREPAFYEYVGARQPAAARPAAHQTRPAAQVAGRAAAQRPWRSPYVLDLSDRD
jgi:hypothetical protein